MREREIGVFGSGMAGIIAEGLARGGLPRRIITRWTTTSGDASVRPADPGVDGPMVKPESPQGRTSSVSTVAMMASGGGCSTSRRSNVATAAAAPSTSTTTPAEVLETEPLSSSSVAVE